MDTVYVPLLSALTGAMIGAFSSIATIYIQSRIRDRRDQLRLVADLALQDWKTQFEAAKSSGKPVPPLVLTFHYYLKLMAAAERKGLSLEELRRISEDNDRVFDLILEINKSRQVPKSPTPATDE